LENKTTQTFFVRRVSQFELFILVTFSSCLFLNIEIIGSSVSFNVDSR